MEPTLLTALLAAPLAAVHAAETVCRVLEGLIARSKHSCEVICFVPASASQPIKKHPKRRNAGGVERVNTRVLGLLLFVMSVNDALAASYYVSDAGDNSNSGTTEKTAWRTIDKVNTASLRPGDQVLFRRGDVFRGQLQIRESGKPEKPIVVAAYGVGAKPVLSGAIPVTSWTPYRNGIYKASQTNPVTSVYVDDHLQSLARYPNSGFCTIEQGDQISLEDSRGLTSNLDLAGATARIRAVDWQYEIAKVVSHQGNRIAFAQHIKYPCKKGYGYFLDNKLEFLDSDGEWFYDSNEMLLYLQLTDRNNPPSAKVEATVYSYGIVIDPDVSFIAIRDLQLEKHETAGIAGMQNSSHVSVMDCTIRDVGVYGIMLDLNSGNYSVKGNLIEDIRGRGISTIESSDNEISENIIRRIGLHSGYGFDGVNNAIGIAVLKTEATFLISARTIDQLKREQVPSEVVGRVETLVDQPYSDERFLVTALVELLGSRDADRFTPLIVKQVKQEMGKQKLESRNNLVARNVIEDTGYAGIRLDGQNSVAEGNIIKNTLLRMSDGGGIYCWGQNANYTFNNTLRNNIIINVVGNSEGTPVKWSPIACGIYIDQKSHHITIESNTVLKAREGIRINDESHHNRIVGNTCYDNKYGLVFNEFFMPGTLVGCEAYGNILFSKKSDQRALLVESVLREGFRPVTLDGNTYAGYGDLPVIVEKSVKDGVEREQEFSLQQWREYYGQDAQSKTITNGQDSVILVNEGKTPGNFKIPTDAEYCNLQGQALAAEINLPPFSSHILIRKEPLRTP